ncbi:Small nucleolar ribonucleoprotein complex subunit [Zostera marina]|uniref:Small nucleolar ribonucleoprotein complex subunit n=1 Tax=Zostera marina TaxID=29655 RepID=A0A0K9PVE6_ZOSMR|nr:Small nucleolar ribonucleoprotein complex subunit [Zostera marina]
MVEKAELTEIDESEKGLSKELQIKVKKYQRGAPANVKSLKDKRLKGQLADREKLYGATAKAAAKIEKWIMPSEGGYLETDGLEKTWQIKQEDILKEVDILSSRKAFDMILPVLGPYQINYTSSGRYMLVYGRKGHLAIIDMITMDLIKEFQVNETIRDAVFLQNDHIFAAAQRKYVYIYNDHGTEIHCLEKQIAPLKLRYLDKHFLLASTNKLGELHYQDITTGVMVANFQTQHGRTDVMCLNPFNSVIGLGHHNGKFTMWTPNSSKPVISLLSHYGPITAAAFHGGGHLVATAGVDRKIKLWDLRKYEVLHTRSGQAQSLDFSQKGLLALGNGSVVDIWKDSHGNHNYERYMKHAMVKGYQIGKACFRPYEDVLGIGHSKGISSILIPGAGEPNVDTFVANPFETTRQRREKEVHVLMDKLQPETIMLNPGKIGTMLASTKKEKPTEQEIQKEKESAVESAKSIKVKKKTKGRSKPSKVARKKEDHVNKAKQQFWEKEQLSKKRKISASDAAAVDLPKSLQRFKRKKSS